MSIDKTITFIIIFLFISLPAFHSIAASSNTESKEISGQTWWHRHPRWSQWIAGSIGGIVGGLATSALVSGLAYPIYSKQEGVYYPSLSAVSTGLIVGYPLGSALGSGFGVNQSGEFLDQEGNTFGTYLTTSLTVGAIYGSMVLGTVLPSVKGNVLQASLALATPLICSLTGTLSYEPVNDEESLE